MLDLELPLPVLVDGECIDHAHGVALPEALELRDHLALEMRIHETQDQQLHRTDRHRHSSRRLRTQNRADVAVPHRPNRMNARSRGPAAIPRRR